MLPKKIFFLCSFFFLSTISFAQEESQFFRASAEKLEEAQAIQNQSPEQAIVLLEEVIQAKRKGKSGLEAPAYMLLGNIYKDIDEVALAKERFEQAQQFLTAKDADLWAESYCRLGQLALQENAFEQATIYFNRCIDDYPNSKWLVQCQEGLADVAFAQSDFDKSLLNINTIQCQQAGNLDSLTNARLEAKKTQNFVLQNKLPEAEQAYNKAILNTPQKLDDKDIDFFGNANKTFLNSVPSTSSKINTTENVLQQKIQKQLRPEAIVPDQLLLADLYLEQSKPETSARFIEEAKAQLEKTENPNLEAMVFKKSSKVNQQKKDYQKAFEDLQAYVVALEKKKEVEQTKIAKKTDIIKGQRNIDLLEKDISLEAKDRLLLRNQLRNQRIINGLLAFLLLASLVSFFYIMQNVRAKRRANQKLLLKSLRTQMNPHFLFNALNSVNGFIIKNDELAANKFLSNFSKLMRRVLDNSKEDFIPLEEELSLLELYLELEHSRFRDKFDYTVEKNVDKSSLYMDIPPMLIQPFLENAVWHGLRYKKEKGLLSLKIDESPTALTIQIQDDGIGRTQSKALKTANQQQYKSTGLQNIGERLNVINQLYGKNYTLEVQDLYENRAETGTLVRLTIPKNGIR